MGEERSGDMNFDLNLTPGREAAGSGLSLNEESNLEDWVDNPVERVIPTLRQLEQRCQRIRSRLDRQTLPGQSDRLIDNPGNLNVSRPSEGNVVAAAGEEPEMPKMCENYNPLEKDQVSEKKGRVEIGSADGGGFFDCNICFDLAVEPVVTCCGHLFCWPCLSLWLHKHSNSTECPVCKGDVVTSSLIPIYGRGNHRSGVSSFEIPGRPRGRRAVSLRQTYSSTRDISDRIGHHRNSWNLFPWEHLDPEREIANTGIVLPRLTPSRVVQTDHSDQNWSTPTPEAPNLTHNGTNPVTMEIHRFHSLISQLPADRSDPSA